MVARSPLRNDAAVENEVGSDVHVFGCADCPRVSSASATGWTASLVDDWEFDEPQLAFYCPVCSRLRSGGGD